MAEERYNAANPQTVREKAKNEVKEREQREGDLRKILSTVEGRRYFRWMLSELGIFTSGYSPDPIQREMYLGRRQFALQLVTEIETTVPGHLAEVMFGMVIQNK